MRKTFFWLLVAALFTLSCSPGEQKKAGHVLFIGIDGWSSECVRVAEDIPNIRSLMENGSYTYGKRSVMPSASAINWATIFMGIPTEMHGYNEWNSRKPAITPISVSEHGMPETIYTLIRRQHPEAETGCLFNWNGIGYVTDTLAMSWHSFIGMGSEGYTTDDYTQTAVSYIKDKKPEFFTVYYDEQDHAGHSVGWGSKEYFDTMKMLDKQVGVLIQALKDAGIYDDTVIVMSSDHGGRETGHGGFTIQELETPFIICGKNVRAGFEFPEAMMQYDVPATIAAVLGIEIPQTWVGRPMLQVFKK